MDKVKEVDRVSEPSSSKLYGVVFNTLQRTGDADLRF